MNIMKRGNILKFQERSDYYMKYSLCTIMTIILLTACSGRYIQTQKSPELGNTSGNLYTLGLVTEDNDGEIFCISYQDHNSYLTKINKKNTSANAICKTSGLFLNIINDSIYYMNEDDCKIYTMSTTGEYNKKINDVTINSLIIYNDVIYAIGSLEDGRHLYAMDLDGQNLKILSNCMVQNMYLENDMLFFSVYEASEKKTVIYQINLDGTGEKRILADDGITWFGVYKDTICYSTTSYLKKYSLTSGNKSILDQGSIPDQSLNINNGVIYYKNMMKGTFHTLNLDTGKNNAYNDLQYTFIFVANNKIYYYNEEQLFQMNLDCTNKKEIKMSFI